MSVTVTNSEAVRMSNDSYLDMDKNERGRSIDAEPLVVDAAQNLVSNLYIIDCINTDS